MKVYDALEVLPEAEDDAEDDEEDDAEDDAPGGSCAALTPGQGSREGAGNRSPSHPIGIRTGHEELRMGPRHGRDHLNAQSLLDA